ncbi:hypothetical protein ABW19_dt0201294 [Dactylella cylindrospora]|nr:hypothetical protein ABW19_dt0201294 [Dactylella cylindrospora]
MVPNGEASTGSNDPEETQKEEPYPEPQAPPPYSEVLKKDEITMEKSECWRRGRELFATRIRKESAKNVNLETDLKRFFENSYRLQKAIDSCTEIQSQFTAGRESVGILVDTLNYFKGFGDAVFGSAPACVAAIWCDDIETCEKVTGAYDRVVTFAISSLLYETRCRNWLCEKGGVEGPAGRQLTAHIQNKISELVCEILDFIWYSQHHVKPDWGKDDPKSPTIPAKETAMQSHAKPGFRVKVKETGKDAIRKGIDATKDLARASKDLAHATLNTTKESFTNRLKGKADSIEDLYQKLLEDGNLSFQEIVLSSVRGKCHALIYYLGGR